eukprot:6299858-Alexandrium_andersonii.AAC.1
MCIRDSPSDVALLRAPPAAHCGGGRGRGAAVPGPLGEREPGHRGGVRCGVLALLPRCLAPGGAGP